MNRIKCEHCSGQGLIVVDHKAWLSGGEVYEKDIWEECPECEGSGESYIDEEEAV